MPIYPSTKVLPYVYRLDNPITGEFYIGYREANKIQSDLDLPIYRTSKAKVRNSFNDYKWHIIAEFFNGNDAYDYEQYLIYENWNNPLLINDSCYHGKLRFKRSAESIKAQMGKSPNNIKPITQIVKDTGKILNINYKIILIID